MTISTVTALGSAPSLTGVVAFILNRERPTKRWFFATVIMTIGIILLSTSKGLSDFNIRGFLHAIALCGQHALARDTKKLADDFLVGTDSNRRGIYRLYLRVGQGRCKYGFYSYFGWTGIVVVIIGLIYLSLG